MEKGIEKKSLLDRWKDREKKESEPTPISKAPEGADLPLSRGQQRLFFLDRLYPNNPIYNTSEVYTFRGPLDVERLEQSLQAIFTTNTILRCSFHFLDGKPIQKINNELELEVAKFDLSDLSTLDKKDRQDEIMKVDSLKPFDLSAPPLIRTTILKLDAEEHILFATVHHIITDLWSIGIFQEQLAKYYQKLPSAQELESNQKELQFTDYSYWEHQTKVDKIQLDYWKQKLSGTIPNLELPTDYPIPTRPSFKGGTHSQTLSKNLSEKTLELCKELDTTPYVLLLSVYYVLLHRYSGQNDILVGSPISVRASKALEDIIGFFDETIVLRTSVYSDLSFKQLVKRVRMNVMEAFSNKEVPFDQLVKDLKPERSMSGNPFFRTMFIYHDVQKHTFTPKIDLSYTYYNTGIAKFDLSLFFSNEEGVLSSVFEYSKDVFDTVSIQRFQEHFRLILEGVTSNNSSSIKEIPMATEEELLLLEPKRLTEDSLYSRYKSIHEIIVEQAKNNPNETALVFENETLTYKNFDRESDAVARQILKYSKGENQIVGLCVDRSVKMIVGLLGILKAGCAYLPIDLNYPSKRIDFILKDSDVKILLTEKKRISDLESFKGKQVFIDNIENDSSQEDLKVPFPTIDKDHLAYVIYTSGSSGKPKGVPITHGNIISSTEARLNFYPNNPSAFLLMSSISFDSSKAGVFWTLCTGGTLVISKERLEQDIHALSQVIHSNAVSHTLMLPSLYKMLLDYSDARQLESLKAVIVAGEECTPSLGDEHFKKLPETEIYNEYGPTEATVWCIAHKIKKDAMDAIVPIGRAVSNAEVYLLNSSQEAVPFGAIGEIYIGGLGLSKSYINRPELTELAYVAHPFSKNPNAVLYRTGDLGRYRNDGAIEFLGRTDHQIKIRGFRIELSEIENALMSNNTIRDAIVMAESSGQESKNEGAKHLVAYVVGKETIDPKTVKNELMLEIPSYMVPASIIELDNFPELPNGKVDKKALKELGQTFRARSITAKPRNEIESRLVEIWSEVLNQKEIGITDNYFEIGGDSMTSIKMFWLIGKNMKVKLSPNVIFTHPTIEAIAKKIESDKIKNAESFKYVVPYKISGNKLPLFCMHGGEGHVLFYQNLTSYLDADRPVYLVQPKGADGDDKLHESIEEMAEDYLKEILQVTNENAINLVFYCCGPLVVEMANRIKAIGREANIIIVDSSPKYVTHNYTRSDIFMKRVMNNPFATIKKSIQYRWRRLISPLLIDVTKDEFKMRHVKIRTRLQEVRTKYEWKEFDAQCTLIQSKDGVLEFAKKDVENWNYWCNSEVKVLSNSGNHSTIFDMPHAKTLGETIEAECI